MTRKNIPREFKSLPPEIEKEIEIKIKPAVETVKSYI